MLKFNRQFSEPNQEEISLIFCSYYSVNTKRSISDKPISKGLKRVEEYHPFKLILILAMIGSSVIFLFTLIGYLASGEQFIVSDFNIPKAFILGTFVLLFSGFSVVPCVESFSFESFERLWKSLSITLILGAVFVICQIFGWKEMFEAGAKMGESKSATYLFILSGLHGLHFIVGLGFLGWITQQWFFRKKDPVKLLIAGTNPFEKLKLELITLYWHFLDITWIILFLFFLFFVY